MPQMNNWKKNAALFLTSQAISLFGSSVVSFAIVWFITRQTHSGLWVSLLTVSSYLPQFLVSFFAGVWADRYSRKKLIIVADTMITAFTCLLVLLFPRFTNIGIMMAALIVISFIRSVGAGIQTPAGFAGMTAGGLIMASFAGKRDRMKIYGGGIAGFGVLAVMLASTGLFPVYLALMVVFGIILTVVQTASTTFLQENTSEDMIGRVFGLFGSVYSLALPLGMVIFGPLADYISLKVLMIVSGIALVMLGSYSLWRKTGNED